MTLTMPMTETDTAPMLTAVTYQRVSTKEQASKGGRDEGFSIPAQRQANSRKATTSARESWPSSWTPGSPPVPPIDPTCNGCWSTSPRIR